MMLRLQFNNRVALSFCNRLLVCVCGNYPASIWLVVRSKCLKKGESLEKGACTEVWLWESEQ
ncbi:hypothetical protein, partial [Stutzerimonas nitrititolerans]|uniref:hypothetical protein n=1 Tax=Stutzerimonas nitrititolerans TaxID=2482751 RepID=UPI0028A9A20A